MSGPHNEHSRFKKASHLASQSRATVDAVVHVEGARGSAASACNHMSHVTAKIVLHSFSWSMCSSPSVAYYAIAHVRSTRKLCGHRRGPHEPAWERHLKKASS